MPSFCPSSARGDGERAREKPSDSCPAARSARSTVRATKANGGVTGPFHRTPLVEVVPIRRPSSSNRWTSRSSRPTTAARVWGATAITRHAPPQRPAYSPARKSFPGAGRVRRSRRLTAGSWIRRKGTEAWAPSEQVLLHERGIPTGVAADGGDGSGVPGERFDRLFVGGVGEQHRVRPRVEGEPYRQPLLPRP